MARTNLKRSGGYLPRLPAKRMKWGRSRRRSGYRRRTRNNSNRTWTIQTASGQGLQFKTRKLRAAAWRRKLWNDTLAKTHYRSQGNTVDQITTGTTQATGSVNLLFPTFIGVPSRTTAFWTSTGGLLTPDVGETPPTFGPGDLIIRGGRIGFNVNCPDAVTSEIGLTLYVIRTMADPDAGNLPAILPYGVDITAFAEAISRFGKIIYRKSAVLNNQYPSFSYEHRLRVQKVDQEIHAQELGYQIMFIIVVCNLTDGTDETLNVITYHDLSFSGDIIT